MKRFWVLTGLEIKKYLKALPKMLPGALLLALVVIGIGLSGSRILQSTSTENVKSLVENNDESAGGKIAAALVIQDDSKGMNMAKTYLQNLEMVNSVLDIRYVDEEKGREMLKMQEAAVLIIIRADTVAGIMDATNKPIEIFFPKNSGYEAAIFKECVDAAVSILSAFQASVYSVYDFYEAYNVYDKKDGALKRLNIDYISTTLTREQLFSGKEVVVTGELTVNEYYICGALLLFLLFLSIMFVSLMEPASRDIHAKLYMAGVSDGQQLLAALAGPVSVCGILILVTTVVLQMGKIMEWSVLESVDGEQIWQIMLIMLYCSIIVTLFALLICRLTESSMAQVMIMFLVSALQGLVTGCFIPKLLLPDVLGMVAKLCPAEYMIELMSGVFLGEIKWSACFILAAFGVFFAYVTIHYGYIRRRR